MPKETRAEITTILFTDLVGSTELMQRIGDDEAQRVFQEHHDFLRDTVVASSGEPIEWTGDGIMATFSSASAAVRCAVAVQRLVPRGVGEVSLRVRVGLNVGEILRQEEGSGYFGTPLVIARRLCDQADAGQVLCTATVAGLLPGSRSFQFRDLGKMHLKGITEAVAVAEVQYESLRSTRLSLKSFAQLAKTIPDIIVATDELGVVFLFNDEAERVLGYSRQEALGRGVWEFYLSLDEAKRVMAAMHSTGQEGPGRIADFRTIYRTKKGKHIEAVFSGSILIDEDDSMIGTIGIARKAQNRPTDEGA